MDHQQEPSANRVNPKQDDTNTFTTSNTTKTTTTTTSHATTEPSTPTRQSRRSSQNIDFRKLAGECYDDDNGNGNGNGTDPNDSTTNNNNYYANKHIPSLLQKNPKFETSNSLQTVTDGSQLTATNLINPKFINRCADNR